MKNVDNCNTLILLYFNIIQYVMKYGVRCKPHNNFYQRFSALDLHSRRPSLQLRRNQNNRTQSVISDFLTIFGGIWVIFPNKTISIVEKLSIRIACFNSNVEWIWQKHILVCNHLIDRIPMCVCICSFCFI